MFIDMDADKQLEIVKPAAVIPAEAWGGINASGEAVYHLTADPQTAERLKRSVFRSQTALIERLLHDSSMEIDFERIKAGKLT